MNNKRDRAGSIEAPRAWRGTPPCPPRAPVERRAWDTYIKIVELEEHIDAQRLSLTAAHQEIVELARDAFRLAPDVPDLLYVLAESLQPFSFTDPVAHDLMQRARERLDQLGGPSVDVLEGDPTVIAREIHHRKLVAHGLPMQTLDPRDRS